MRKLTFNIRFTDDERERLDLVARHYGLNGAAVIRMLVKRERERIALEKPVLFESR